ncbi:tagaturonate epimerase family protein [Candidatus Omnitrophota bacterium]
MEDMLRKELLSDALNGKISVDSLKQTLSGEKDVVTDSISQEGECLFMMAESKKGQVLVAASQSQEALSGFSGDSMTVSHCKEPFYAVVCPLSHDNAISLRKALPRTAPSVLDCRESFGTGDRIGNTAPATPGHIAALDNTGMTPVLAQQSVRENHKTGRTYEEVMDDVTWTVFRTGYDQPWGSDADHQKNIEEIEESVKAGFTLFTLDPSDLIDNAADTDSEAVLKEKLGRLFKEERNAYEMISRYEFDGADRIAAARSAVKYTGAIRHAVTAYRRLTELLGESGFNFELSIDETSTTTTALDHRMIATECIREGVNLFSLAPRFEGAFEKGIDYIGSIDAFRWSLKTHVELSRELGDYRLSLHSGSDKFSVYPIFGELTDGFFHIKTAGTSYLEAVKVAAHADMNLFRRILELSLETFEENAASYEISANAENVPSPADLGSDSAIKEIEDNPDMRQVLHIAFGVVLDGMGGELRALLSANADTYKDYLVRHIGRHVAGLRGK